MRSGYITKAWPDVSAGAFRVRRETVKLIAATCVLGLLALTALAALDLLTHPLIGLCP